MKATIFTVVVIGIFAVAAIFLTYYAN